MKISIKTGDWGTLKGIADVTFDEPGIGEIIVKGFKIMVGQDGGLWVAMPSKEVQKEGEKKYINIVYVPDQDGYTNFRNAIIDAYKVECGETPTNREKPVAKPAVKREPKPATKPAAKQTPKERVQEALDAVREPVDEREPLPEHDENPFPGEDCPF